MNMLKSTIFVLSAMALQAACAERLTYAGPNGGTWHAAGVWRNEADASVSWTDGATAVVGDVDIVLNANAVAEGFDWTPASRRTLTGSGRLSVGAGGLVNGGALEANISNVGGLHLTADQTWTSRATSGAGMICLDGMHPVTTAEGVTVTVTGRTQLRWNARAALPATTTFHVVAPAYISFSPGNAAFGSPTVILDGNGNRLSFGNLYDQKNCIDGVLASVLHLRNGADMVFVPGYATQLGIPRIVVDGTPAAGDMSSISGAADTSLTQSQTVVDVASGCCLDFSLTCAEKDVSASFVKTGEGLMKLRSAKAVFTGGVDVRAGTAEIASAAGAGTGPVAVASSATLALTAAGTLPNDVSGAGTLMRSGTGLLELTGDVSGFSGDMALVSGTLRTPLLKCSVALSEGAAWAVTGEHAYEKDIAPRLAPRSAGTVLAGAGGTCVVGTLDAASPVKLDAEKGGLLRAGALVGVDWTKSGDGDVRIESLASYTGTKLAVSAGVLQFASPAVIPAGCAVLTDGDGIVQFDTVEGYDASKIGGTQAVAFADGASTTVDTSSPDGVPGRLSVAEGRTLNVTKLTGTGDFYKRGAGTLCLSGAEAFAGRIYVLGGKLEIVGDAGVNDIVVSNGVCSVVGSGTVLRNTFKVHGGVLQADAGGSLGAGTLTLTSAGTVCATNGGTFGWSALAVSAGTVRIAQGGVVATTALTTKPGGTLAVVDGSGISVALTLSGGALSFESDTVLAAPVTQSATTDIRVADGKVATLTGLFTNTGGKCQPKGPGELVFAGGGSFLPDNAELFVQGGTATIATNDFTFGAYFGVENVGKMLRVTDGAKVTAKGAGKGLHIATGKGIESVLEVSRGAKVELQAGIHTQLGASSNAIGRIRVVDGGVFRHLSDQYFRLSASGGTRSCVEVRGGTFQTTQPLTKGSGTSAEVVFENATLVAGAGMTLVGANITGTVAGENTLDVGGYAVTLGGVWSGDGSLAVTGADGTFALAASQPDWMGALSVQGAGLALGADVDLANASVSVSGGEISVASGRASLPLLAGASAVKSGVGTLQISAVDDPALELVVESGAVQVVPSAKLRPAGVPAAWLDATVAESFTKSGNAISQWADRRGAGHSFYAKKVWNAPVYNADGFDGRPFVDFGVMADSIKGRSGDNRMLEFGADQTNIRAVFWMVGSRNGGGFLLGDRNVAGSARCFHRSAGPDTTYGAVPSDPLWNSGADRGGWVKGGTTWLNGQVVDGTKTGLSGGWDLVGWRLSEADDAANRTPTAIWLASCYNDAGGRLNGGQDLAEILIYTNRLTDAEVRATQRYLADKWLPTNAANRVTLSRLVMRGADTSFTSPSGVPVFVGVVLVEGTGVTVRGVEAGPSDQVVLGTVNVASGAEWDAAGFRGTEVTNVAFAADAVVCATVDAQGRSEGLTVQGSVSLPPSLLYRVANPERTDVHRAEILKSLGVFAGSPSWTRAPGSDSGAVVSTDAAAHALVLKGNAGAVIYLR